MPIYSTDVVGCGLERKGRRRSPCSGMNFAPVEFGCVKEVKGDILVSLSVSVTDLGYAKRKGNPL